MKAILGTTVVSAALLAVAVTSTIEGEEFAPQASVDGGTLEPAAVNRVKKFLCRQDFTHLVYGNTTITAAANCTKNPRGQKVLDPVFDDSSLATTAACNQLETQTCEERFPPDGQPSCRLANNAQKFLCGCRGAGTVRAPDGTKYLDGLLRSFKRLDTSRCDAPDAGTYTGKCLFQPEMTANQWWTLKQIVGDDNLQKFPQPLQDLASSMTADGRAATRRGNLQPMCLRRSVPRRMGHADTEPTSDEDAGTPP